MKTETTVPRQEIRDADRLTRCADMARILVLAVGACDGRRQEVDERDAAALEAFTFELAEELDALGGWPADAKGGAS